jgi:hypothetical protein
VLEFGTEIKKNTLLALLEMRSELSLAIKYLTRSVSTKSITENHLNAK